MSICIMFRKCAYCRRSYPYNPSVGNFGLICSGCGKVQPVVADGAQRDKSFEKDLKKG